MLFSDVYGQDNIKKHLTQSVHNARVPHANLFIGPEGSGTLPMAIAYAQYLLCKNTDGENNSGDHSCNLKFNNLSHPDLHFAFPVNTTESVKSKPVSSLFLSEW
jgi:DNA polymerase-3 subunit delta'